MIETISTKDRELLEGLRRADPKPIRALYNNVLPAVLLDIRSLRGNEADARDVFQEALLALYRRLTDGKEFRLTCSLKSYLRVMCRNLWISRLRRRGREQPLSSLEETVELDDNVQRAMETAERHRIYLEYFAQLGEKCQQILQLFFEKIPLKVIAKQLNTSESYIKKRKFICKERLLRQIQDDPRFREL